MPPAPAYPAVDDEEDQPPSAPKPLIGTTGGVIPEQESDRAARQPTQWSPDPTVRQGQVEQEVARRRADQFKQEHPFTPSSWQPQINTPQTRYEDRQVAAGAEEQFQYQQQTARAAEVGRRRQQVEQTNAYNSAALADFKSKGIKHYLDPATGRYVAEVTEKGQPKYERTTWASGVDPQGRPSKVMRDELGQRQFKRPPLTLGTDPHDEYIYADMGDGESQPYMKAAEAAASKDVSLARLGLRHITRQNQAARLDALRPIKEISDSIDLEMTTATANVELLKTEIAAAWKSVPPGTTPDEKFTADITQKREQLRQLEASVKPGGDLHQKQTQAKLGKQIVAAEITRDTHADQEKEILARLTQEGVTNPELDPAYVDNHARLLRADAAAKAATTQQARYATAMAGRGKPRSVGGVGIEEFERRYGSDADPVQPASLLKLNQRSRDIDATLKNSGTSVSDTVRTSMQQEKAYIDNLYTQRLAKLTPEQQKRVVDATRDPTLGEKAEHALGRSFAGLEKGLASAGKGLISMALSQTPGGVKNPTIDAHNNAATRALDRFAARADTLGAENVSPEVRAKLQEGFATSTLPEALGSAGSFMIPGTAVGKAGRALQMSERALRGLTTATVGVMGAAANSSDFRSEAERHLRPQLEAGKITPEEFATSLGMAELFGGAVGATEMVPLGKFAQRIAKIPSGQGFLQKLFQVAGRGGSERAAKWLQGTGKEILAEAAEEGGQELIQALAQDLYASETFDPNRKIGDTAAEQAAAGGITGALLAAVTRMIGGKRGAAAPNQTPPPAAPPAGETAPLPPSTPSPEGPGGAPTSETPPNSPTAPDSTQEELAAAMGQPLAAPAAEITPERKAILDRLQQAAERATSGTAEEQAAAQAELDAIAAENAPAQIADTPVKDAGDVAMEAINKNIRDNAPPMGATRGRPSDLRDLTPQERADKKAARAKAAEPVPERPDDILPEDVGAVESDLEIATETNEQIAKRHAPGPGRDAAMAERTAASKRIAKTLKRGDRVGDFVVEEVNKDGTINTKTGVGIYIAAEIQAGEPIIRAEEARNPTETPPKIPADEPAPAKAEPSTPSPQPADGGARGEAARGETPVVSEAGAGSNRPNQVPEFRQPDGSALGRSEEQAKVREWAQANNKLIDSAAFDRQWQEQGQKGGSENEVVVSEDGKTILKRNNNETMGLHPNHNSLADYFDHVALHNEIFPESKLDFVGMSETESGLAPVVSQEFVESERAATPAEIKAHMEELGFTQKGKTSFDNTELGVRVGDLHDQNVLVDRAGELHFIDPIIKRIGEPKAAAEPTAKNDYERHQEINREWAGAVQRGEGHLDRPEIKKLFNENEKIKSRHGGMPPKAPKAAPAVAAKPAPALKLPKDAAPVSAAVTEATPESVEGEKLNKNWTAFDKASGTLGIPRAEMPQVKSEARGALVNFLRARDIPARAVMVNPSSLKPTQAEFSPTKVDQARNFRGSERPVLISADGHLVDGHHQWMAGLQDDPNTPMPAIKLGAPIDKVLAEMKEFPSTESAPGIAAKTAAKEPSVTGPATKKLSDRAIEALSSAKYDIKSLRKSVVAENEGMGNRLNQIPDAYKIAHNAAIDLVVLAIRAGRTIADAVKMGIARFKAKHPSHTPEELSNFETSLNSYVAGPPPPTDTKATAPSEGSATPAATPSGMTFTGPVNPSGPEFRKRSKSSLGEFKQEYTAGTDASKEKYAQEFADWHEKNGTYESAVAEMRSIDDGSFRAVVASELLARQLEAEANANAGDRVVAQQRIDSLWGDTIAQKSQAGQELQAQAVVNRRLRPFLPVLTWKGLIRQRLETNIGSKFPEDVGAKVQKGVDDAGTEAADVIKDAIEGRNKEAERIIKAFARAQSDTQAWGTEKAQPVRELVEKYITKKITATEFQSALSALGVKEDAASRLNAVADREMKTQEFDAWFKRNEQSEAFLSKHASTLKLLRDAAKARDLKWGDIFNDLPENLEARKTELFDRVKANPKLADLSPAHQKRLAENLNEAWTDLRNQIFRKEFSRLVDLPNVAKPDVEKVKSVVDEFIKASNLGLLDNTAFLNAMAEKYGMEKMDGPTAKKLTELAQKIQRAPADSAEKARLELELVKTLHIASGAKVVDLMTAYSYANILSGITTLTGGMIVPNIQNSLTQMASMAVVNPRKAGTLLRGYAHGFPEGIRQAISIMATGHGGQDAAAILAETQGDALDLMASGDIFPKLKAKLPVAHKGLSMHSKALRMVTRFVRAIDAVAYYPAKEAYTWVATEKLLESKYSGAELASKLQETLQISPSAWASVKAQAEREGFTGHELSRRMSDILEQRRQSSAAGKEGLDRGKRFGSSTTLTQTPEGWAGVAWQGLQNLVTEFTPGSVPALKPFFMFLRVPTNFYNATMNYSPMGAVRATLGTVPTVQKKNGQRVFRKLSPDERMQLYVQSLAGVMAMAYFATRALSHKPDDEDLFDITATGPRNATQRAQWLAAGNMPYSMRIPGTKTRFSYRNSPLAVPLALSGHMTDWARYDDRPGNEARYQKALTTSLMRLPSVIFGAPMLQGLSQLAEMTNEFRPSVSKTERFIKNLGTNLVVPRLLTQIDQIFRDDISREDGIVQYDSLGEPIHNNPFSRQVGQETTDPLRRYLDRNEIVVPYGSEQTTLNGERMSPAQHSEYTRRSGTMIRMQLNSRLPELRTLPNEDAREEVEKIARDVHKEVRQQMSASLPPARPKIGAGTRR